MFLHSRCSMYIVFFWLKFSFLKIATGVKQTDDGWSASNGCDVICRADFSLCSDWFLCPSNSSLVVSSLGTLLTQSAGLLLGESSAIQMQTPRARSRRGSLPKLLAYPHFLSPAT